MGKAGLRLGYEPVREGARLLARFRCTRCPATLDVAVDPVRPSGPVWAACNVGWLAYADDQAGTLCPSCDRTPGGAMRSGGGRDPMGELRRLAKAAAAELPA